MKVSLHPQSSIREELHFSSQSQKFNFTKNKLEKLVITINDNKKTSNAHKEIASNDSEMINIDEKIVKMIFEQTFTKIIVTKKQLQISTIIMLF